MNTKEESKPVEKGQEPTAEIKVDVDIEPIDAELPHDADDDTKKRSSKLPYLLLFILIVVGGLIYAPADLKDHLSEKAIEYLRQAKIVDHPAPPAVKQPEKKATPPVRKAEVEKRVEPKVVKPAAPMQMIVSASSEEVDRMLGAMKQLQGEITQLRRQQQQLEELQHSVQRMQLRSRLQWITDPANHLPQIKLAWEEITLMPAISDDERQLARRMLALANDRLADIRKWQSILIDQAEPIRVKPQANIIPRFNNEWLEWIADQFSLRRTLSDSEAKSAALRDQVIAVGRDLEIEAWPEQRQWLQLRSRLQLKATTSGVEGVKPIELPESFDSISSDIDTLRQSAHEWLGRL